MTGCSNGYPNYGACDDPGLLPFTGSQFSLVLAGIGLLIVALAVALLVMAAVGKWKATR